MSSSTGRSILLKIFLNRQHHQLQNFLVLPKILFKKKFKIIYFMLLNVLCIYKNFCSTILQYRNKVSKKLVQPVKPEILGVFFLNATYISSYGSLKKCLGLLSILEPYFEDYSSIWCDDSENTNFSRYTKNYLSP